jgi:DNA helicase-2/ATP-dependent DNA helicase PcrA
VPEKPESEDVAIAHEEEALCDKVTSHLKDLRPSRPPPRFDHDQTLITLRDEIASARIEDVPALIQQMEQVAAVQSQLGKQQVEPIDPKSPYFGHLRLEEKGRGKRDVLIGKTTYIDPRAGIRIVDWRHAPVSQLYYRYEEGARYEEVFGEREVEGTVLARRTLAIADGKLARVMAPQGTYVRRSDGWHRVRTSEVRLQGGEGTAVRAEHMRGVLGAGDVDQREDRHLPEISALLDPRQFEVISRPDSGVVVVQGGAGSGKTTIGVHRMAYLAYNARSRFTPERMLVVVGTPALREYIRQLLEALGLEGVRVVTFAGWAQRARLRHFPWLDLPVEEDAPPEVARMKTDRALLDLVAAGAKKLRAEGRTQARDALWLWAELLTDRDRLASAFEKRGFARLSREQLERAWRWCADRCPAVVDHKPEEAGADDEPDAVEGADGVVEREDERARLDPEDDALLLRIHQLACGPLRDKSKKGLRYEHLFVDEAQDLAPIDFTVLADVVSSGKCITLAGDTSQRLNVETGFTHWGEVTEVLGTEHVAVEPLRIAYRSTREVLRFARDVLGPLVDPDEPVATRSGAPVEHHHLPTQGAAAAFLADALRPLVQREPRATVAVLARYPEQADAYHDALVMAEVPNLRRIRHYEFAFRPGVEVTEIRQVKGLEYDYVILVDVNAPTYPGDTDEARYQLHIGATRAAHQLWVVSTGTVSPLVPGWLKES